MVHGMICCDRCDGYYQFDTDAATAIVSDQLSVPVEAVSNSVTDEVIVPRVAGGKRGTRGR